MGKDEYSERHREALDSKALREIEDVPTPYGKLLQNISFSGDPSITPEVVHIINPFALLWYLASLSRDFFNFPKSSLGDRPGAIVFYTDEVEPGNDKRGDEGRKYYAVF